ncbi:hypothetical protein BMS3Abin06_01513 [bacterium BMS3Abin06]|nr:hypothetical protein BMS3Abin06_01513 [bacterium BMS3Abin06]
MKNEQHTSDVSVIRDRKKTKETDTENGCGGQNTREE